MGKRKPAPTPPTPDSRDRETCSICGNLLDKQTFCQQCGGYLHPPKLSCPKCFGPLDIEGKCFTCLDFMGPYFVRRPDGLYEARPKTERADPAMEAEASRLLAAILDRMYNGHEGKARLQERFQELDRKWPGCGWGSKL